MNIDYVISHPVGLYAYLADELVSIANRFESEITISYNNKEVNMKSLMGVISLGVPCQGKINIHISGVDEILAKQTIITYLRDTNPFYY